MIRSLWSGATGMSAQQLNIDVIANNLANVNTNGFKRSRADFQDLMYQTIRAPGATTATGATTPTGLQVGMGVRPIAIQKLFTQGEYTQTGNQLDLAIEGKGFFKVLRGTEELYTRSGAYKLDKDGYVVDSEGNRLQPEFAVPANTVSIAVDSGGRIVALGSDGTELGAVQLQLYTFTNPAGLFSKGKNYFIPTPASGDPTSGTPGVDGVGTIAQGFLEMSNVNVVEEMVAMIIAHRAYEANSKTIQTSDQLLQMANNVKR